jgi:hypothetical protein
VIDAAFDSQPPNLIFLAGYFGTLPIGYACYRFLERTLQRLGRLE